MYFGGTVIASSWGIVAIVSIWSKKISESGAFWGMLLGFLGCVIPKAYSALKGITLPIYLDPFFIGVVLSALGIIIGSIVKRATKENQEFVEELHVRPASEIDIKADKKTHNLTWVYATFSIALGLFFVFSYAIPYLKSI